MEIEHTTGDRFYFAYGSNMDSRQMRVRCRGAYFVGVARLRDFEFRINRRGVATIVQRDRSDVYGVLWKISQPDERSLDAYEGVLYGTYEKRFVEVETGPHNLVRALAYVARDSSRGVPRPDYLERIVTAAKEHQLPARYVETLDRWERQVRTAS